MTKTQIIAQIQQFIVTNGNNEITAAVLRPILEGIVNQANSLIGELNSLNTQAKNDLVAAINSVIEGNSSQGVKIHSGTVDPNVQPPMSYVLGDFYRLTSGGTTIGYYVYSGTEWVLLENPSNSVYNGIRTTTSALTVNSNDFTLVYNGTVNSSWVIPSASTSLGRELRIVNRSANTITLNASYFDASGSAGINTVEGGTVVHLQSAGNQWYKIN